jgi:beta-galactosidase
VWEEDVRLMGEAGVDLVTVGVFAWAELQAGPGCDLDAGWLDRILGRLGDAGIGVDLATATASPPAWLVSAHPEVLPVDVSGVRLSPGSRQHYCPSSPAYRAAAVELVERLADRYGAHPALEMWHVGNEYGCHVPACYCEVSAAAFRVWLERRYGELDALNRAWGTAFWGQRYRSWEEIGPPRAAPSFVNPTQRLDWARFCDHELRACYEAERAVLAAATPQVPVTTNLMGLFAPVDGWAWASRMDLVSLDRYPDPADPDAHLGSALTADLARSLAGGRPWVLMEQAPGAVNWRAVNAAKTRGQFRTWSLQAVGRGADAILQFQWRASAFGSEKFHSGMVPHAGTDSRLWREVIALGGELDRLDGLAGTTVRADVAFVLDWHSWWALELDAHPSAELRLPELLVELYRPLFRRGVTVDFVHPSGDLAAYRLILVPALYLVGGEDAARLDAYVAGGGTALVSYFSGVVDLDDHVRLGGYPAPWRELLGLRVEEFAPLPPGVSEPLEGPLAAVGSAARRWQEWSTLGAATALLRYSSGPLAGQAAATVHEHGSGRAYYLGTSPDPDTLARLVVAAAEGAGVGDDGELPEGVESVSRGGHRFVLNHAGEERTLSLGPVSRRDLLTGAACAGEIRLPPGGALVLAPPASSP